jgi:hypothetical protein
MVQGGARASEWLLPSSVESTQVLGLKSCPAAGLHNRNAAGPGYHISEVARTGFLVFRVNTELRRLRTTDDLKGASDRAPYFGSMPTPFLP